MSEPHRVRPQGGQQPPKADAPVMKVTETYTLCDRCDGATTTSNDEPCMSCRATGRKFQSIVYQYSQPMPANQTAKPQS